MFIKYYPQLYNKYCGAGKVLFFDFSGIFCLEMCLFCWAISGLVFFLFIAQQSLSVEIDSSISQAITNSGKISMRKNLILLEKTVETTTTAESSFKRNTVDVWSDYDFLSNSLVILVLIRKIFQRIQ